MRWHSTHFKPLWSGLSSTVALQTGHTRISSRSLLIAIAYLQLNKPSRAHFSPRLGDGRQVLVGAVLDDVEAAFLDRLGIHQLAAYGHRAGAGLEEVAGSFQIDATRGNHFDLREGSLQRLDILGAAYVAAGKDLDHVGAGLPGGEHFGGGQRAGANDFGVALGHLDGREAQAGGDEELGAG